MKLDNSFTEADVKKYAEALNFIAKDALFNSSDDAGTVRYAISLRNHFAHLQSLLPKLEAHIAEIKQVNHKKQEESVEASDE